MVLKVMAIKQVINGQKGEITIRKISRGYCTSNRQSVMQNKMEIIAFYRFAQSAVLVNKSR